MEISKRPYCVDSPVKFIPPPPFHTLLLDQSHQQTTITDMYFQYHLQTLSQSMAFCGKKAPNSNRALFFPCSKHPISKVGVHPGHSTHSTYFFHHIPNWYYQYITDSNKFHPHFVSTQFHTIFQVPTPSSFQACYSIFWPSRPPGNILIQVWNKITYTSWNSSSDR